MNEGDEDEDDEEPEDDEEEPEDDEEEPEDDEEEAKDADEYEAASACNLPAPDAGPAIISLGRDCPFESTRRLCCLKPDHPRKACCSRSKRRCTTIVSIRSCCSCRFWSAGVTSPNRPRLLLRSQTSSAPFGGRGTSGLNKKRGFALYKSMHIHFCV